MVIKSSGYSEPGFTRKDFLVCTFPFFFLLILNLRKVTHVQKFSAQNFLFQERKCGQWETNHLKMRKGTSPDTAGLGLWGCGSASLQFQLLALSLAEGCAYLDCKVMLSQNALVPISFSRTDFGCLAGARRFKEEGLEATVGTVWNYLFSCSLSKHPIRCHIHLPR